MWPNIVELRDFYSSSLGQLTCRLVRRQICNYWPVNNGMNILGLGFTEPYLRPFYCKESNVIAIAPEGMGVLPSGETEKLNSNAVCLSDESNLPFSDLSMDRIILVHSLEYTNKVNELLRELWRILADGGRLIIVVPNRRGAWAHDDKTPFGQGHPYSLEQLNKVLRQSMFTPLRGKRALFIPPSNRRFWLTMAPAWESLGARWFRVLGGVVIVESAKQIYAGTPAGERPVSTSYSNLSPEVFSRFQGIKKTINSSGLIDK
ncbi:MAG: class I SAM-dependent methyltransferase [Alphaproteobacteria bacterium]|jgi:SAM-dependent methyltransferase|nr:class I SAM-dependent methyltransferase [Alphaproteobacteria bacterium]